VQTFTTVYLGDLVSDIAIFVLKRDIKLQLTNLGDHGLIPLAYCWVRKGMRWKLLWSFRKEVHLYSRALDSSWWSSWGVQHIRSYHFLVCAELRNLYIVSRQGVHALYTDEEECERLQTLLAILYNTNLCSVQGHVRIGGTEAAAETRLLLKMVVSDCFVFNEIRLRHPFLYWYGAIRLSAVLAGPWSTGDSSSEDLTCLS